MTNWQGKGKLMSRPCLQDLGSEQSSSASDLIPTISKQWQGGKQREASNGRQRPRLLEVGWLTQLPAETRQVLALPAIT